MLLECVVRKLPHALERGIVQPDPTIASKDCYRLRQMIECLALHLDERVVTTMHIKALGHVVVEVGHAAFRIWRSNNAQRAPVGKMPSVFFGLDRPIGFVKLLPPLAEVLLLRQLSLVAQTIEYSGVGRCLIEEACVKLEQCTKGGIVERQLTIDVEN